MNISSLRFKRRIHSVNLLLLLLFSSFLWSNELKIICRLEKVPQRCLEKDHGFGSVEELFLSSSMNVKLAEILREKFVSVRSIHFSSPLTNVRSLCPSVSLPRHFTLDSILHLSFDDNSYAEVSLLNHCPQLERLILYQSVWNHFFSEKRSFSFSFSPLSSLRQLTIYRFELHYLSTVLEECLQLRRLRLLTLSSEDEPPVRSFLQLMCHHRHRPVSLVDLLGQIFRRCLPLEILEVGCCFERDELHLHGIISSILRKSLSEQIQFQIHSEPFQSTRCGTVQIHFFSSPS